MKRYILHIIIMLAAFAAPALTISAQEKFSRGIEMTSFIPKGQWITGINVSYSQSNQNNYQFLIIENIDGNTYTFRVSPMLLFCFKDNMAAGGRFSYSRSRTHLDNANVIIDSETSYDIDNLYSISHDYYGTMAFRNYIALGNTMRFAFFNEVQLKVGGGQSKIVNGTGDDITGTFQQKIDVGIGLTPGMTMFLNNYSAIEVSIGVLGFNYTHSHAVTDQIYVADTNYKSANFKINLFSVSFGVVFYL